VNWFRSGYSLRRDGEGNWCYEDGFRSEYNFVDKLAWAVW
jgi:hypothetical protein